MAYLKPLDCSGEFGIGNMLSSSGSYMPMKVSVAPYNSIVFLSSGRNNTDLRIKRQFDRLQKHSANRKFIQSVYSSAVLSTSQWKCPSIVPTRIFNLNLLTLPLLFSLSISQSIITLINFLFVLFWLTRATINQFEYYQFCHESESCLFTKCQSGSKKST